MTDQERLDAIKVLRQHHRDGTAAAWSLAEAVPVAVHEACYEFKFMSPNGATGFILADGIPRPVTGPASLARARSVSAMWNVVYAERRRVAATEKRKRKVKR